MIKMSRNDLQTHIHTYRISQYHQNSLVDVKDSPTYTHNKNSNSVCDIKCEWDGYDTTYIGEIYQYKTI